MDALSGLFESGNLPLMKRALTAYALRHRVVAENLANVATEGYEAQRVAFEEKFEEKLNLPVPAMRTHPAHLPVGGEDQPEAQIVKIGSEFSNGINDVDPEREALELAQNQLMYRMATRLLSRRYDAMRMAITGRTQ